MRLKDIYVQHPRVRDDGDDVCAGCFEFAVECCDKPQVGEFGLKVDLEWVKSAWTLARDDVVI